MKQGHSCKTSRSPRASPAPEKKAWVRRHPLASSIFAGAALFAVLRAFDGAPHRPQLPESGSRKPDAGLVSKEGKSAPRIRELRRLIKSMKAFADSGVSQFTASGEDFGSWKEGLRGKSVAELRTIWRTYNMIMEGGTANDYIRTGVPVDWDEAGSRAQDAERRRNAAGREIRRRKEAGEEIPPQERRNTEPEPEWLGGLRGKTLPELEALLAEEERALSDAQEWHSDSVKSGDEEGAGEASSDFEETQNHIRAIRGEGNARMREAAGNGTGY
jgi:hypothetical protein